LRAITPHSNDVFDKNFVFWHYFSLKKSQKWGVLVGFMLDIRFVSVNLWKFYR